MHSDKNRVAVIDYGAGNIMSMINSLSYIGTNARVLSSPENLSVYTHIIIPGVGSFDEAMNNLNQSGMVEVLNQAKNDGVLILGVCLGMQILCSGSDEGSLPGLKWMDLRVKRLSQFESVKKVPHMGWNELIINNSHPLLLDLPSESDVYFVHSFGVTDNYNDYGLSETNCGVLFASIIGLDNVYGMQFHPEKSQNIGLKLLENFLNLRANNCNG